MHQSYALLYNIVLPLLSGNAVLHLKSKYLHQILHDHGFFVHGYSCLFLNDINFVYFNG